MKTTEQAKDEALLEIMGITDSQNSQDWIEVINRAMEIYLESYKQELREKLPSNAEIAEMYPDDIENEMDSYYWNSLQRMKRISVQVFRDKVKELLK